MTQVGLDVKAVFVIYRFIFKYLRKNSTDLHGECIERNELT